MTFISLKDSVTSQKTCSFGQLTSLFCVKQLNGMHLLNMSIHVTGTKMCCLGIFCFHCQEKDENAFKKVEVTIVWSRWCCRDFFSNWTDHGDGYDHYLCNFWLCGFYFPFYFPFWKFNPKLQHFWLVKLSLNWHQTNFFPK